MIESVEANIHKSDFYEKGREFRPNHVVVSLLDYSKAFDRMSRPILLDFLYKNGEYVRERAIPVFSNVLPFLFRVEMKKKRERFLVKKGKQHNILYEEIFLFPTLTLGK